MVFEVRVGCHEDSETFFFGSVQQLAVLQGGPATLMGGDYLMLRQEPPQWDRSTLVKQYAHSSNSQGAPRRVLQHGANLLDSDAGKPLNELRDERTVLEVLEERRHWDAAATKEPGTTYAFGIAFNGRTGRPIDHGLHITTGPEETANVSVTGARGFCARPVHRIVGRRRPSSTGLMARRECYSTGSHRPYLDVVTTSSTKTSLLYRPETLKTVRKVNRFDRSFPSEG